MTRFRDVVAYLCAHYPRPRALSPARVAKLAYLVDWRAAIRTGHPVTEAEWVLGEIGPEAAALDDVLREGLGFTVAETVNAAGDTKRVIQYTGPRDFPSLSLEQRETCDFVIETTKDRYWNDLMRLVVSTFPVVTHARGSVLDLEQIAARYLEQGSLLDAPSTSAGSTSAAPNQAAGCA